MNRPIKQGIRDRTAICALILPALAVGLALALGIPGAASGLVSKQNTMTVRGGGIGEMLFRCKGARRAWASGFAGTFRPARGQRVLPENSLKPQRREGGREWFVSAENSGREAGRLTGYVYCRKASRLRAAKLPGMQKRGPRPGEFTRTVRCRPDQGRVVSGGFRTFGVRIYGSRKTAPRRWSVSWFNPDNPHPVHNSFETFAYCRPGPNTKPWRAAIRVASGQTAKISARCHRNERILSGGFANPDFDSDGGPQMFAHISRRAGNKHRWTVVAHNLGDAPGTLVAFAYCRAR
jgi:hypothetical protein